FVPSPQVSGGSLVGAAAITANDIWAVGGISISNGEQTLAEHFNGTRWGVVSTPSPTSDSAFNGVAAAAPPHRGGRGVWGDQQRPADRALERHQLERGPQSDAADGKCAESRDGARVEQCLGRRDRIRVCERLGRALGRHELERCVQPRLYGRDYLVP